MTLRSLINFGQSLKQVAGVNIKILDANDYEISYCILKKDKDIVTVEKFETDLHSISELEDKLNKNLHENSQLHINIEGRGILTKVSEVGADSFNRTETIKKLFPIIKIEEFAIQSYTIGASIFFHALRNDLLDKFKTLTVRHSVISFSMGPFIVAPLGAVIHREVLDLDDYKVSFSNGRITKLELSQSQGSDVLIDDKLMPSKAILAYASAWNVLVPNADIKISSLPWIESSVEKSSFNHALYSSARLGLISLLAILLINALINFSLQSKADQLVQEQAMYSGKKNENDDRFKKLSSLTSFHDKIGWESNQIPVYYADQIGGKVTTEIQLSLLEIGVLNSDVLRKEKKYLYQNKLIKVKGFTQTPMGLKKWIDDLENLEWIANIADQKYQYDTRQGKGLFEFYIYVK